LYTAQEASTNTQSPTAASEKARDFEKIPTAHTKNTKAQAAKKLTEHK
jgi:hypothetical protein